MDIVKKTSPDRKALVLPWEGVIGQVDFLVYHLWGGGGGVQAGGHAPQVLEEDGAGRALLGRLGDVQL